MSRRNRRGNRTGTPSASIDMNSLIDLTFLLLVTFMLTIPTLENGVQVMLPHGKTDKLPAKNNKANSITLDAENRCYFNDKPVTLDELEAILSAKVAEDPDVPVLVRGDERLNYGSVMEAVKICHKLKVRRMALVTIEN